MKELLTPIFKTVFEEKLIDEIANFAVFKNFIEGEILLDIGNSSNWMPLLLNGTLKISREDKHQGELLLYFIEKGDTCAITLTSCINKSNSEIRATAETTGQIVFIPLDKMEDWLETFSSWRNFIFFSYNNRMKEMLTAIDSIAFLSLEDRIWSYLIDKSKIKNTRDIHCTHHEIAIDLNSSRVVISRILKHLEQKNRIQLRQGIITLKDQI
jgi:CRP/FNR family transcriptional regulator